MRRRLAAGVRKHTRDDFNYADYPQLTWFRMRAPLRIHGLTA
jgi:hypothetical protein